MRQVTGCSSDVPWESTTYDSHTSTDTRTTHIFSENTVLTPCKNAPELNVGMCPSTQFLFLSLSAIMGVFLANRPIQLAPERKWAPQCNYIIGLIGEFWEAFCWTQPSSASPSSLRCSSFPLICFEHRKPQRLLLWLHIWFGIKMTHGVGLNYVIYAHQSWCGQHFKVLFCWFSPTPNRHSCH